MHDAVILDNDSLALGGGAGCEHDERVILLPAKGGNGAEIGGAQVGKTKSVLTPSGFHQMDAGGFQRYEPVIKLFITQDVLEICLCCQRKHFVPAVFAGKGYYHGSQFCKSQEGHAEFNTVEHHDACLGSRLDIRYVI